MVRVPCRIYAYTGQKMSWDARETTDREATDLVLPDLRMIAHSLVLETICRTFNFVVQGIWFLISISVQGKQAGLGRRCMSKAVETWRGQSLKNRMAKQRSPYQVRGGPKWVPNMLQIVIDSTQISIKYMDLYIYKIYRNGWEMVGNRWGIVGIILPMCSAPGHSWQGPFFCSKIGPLSEKWHFCVFLT